MKAAKYIFFLLMFIVSSCSMVQIGYSIADWYIKKEILSYVKLYTGQQKELEKNLDDYMLWHRKNMIPRYVKRIDEIASHVEKIDLSKVESQVLVGKVANKIRKDFADTFVPLAMTTVGPFSKLGNEQIQRSRELIAKKFKKQRDKRKKYNATEAMYVWSENTKDWFGYVSPVQKEWLSKNKEKIVFKKMAKEKVVKMGHRNNTFLDIFDDKDPLKRVEKQKKYWQELSESIVEHRTNNGLKGALFDYLSLLELKQKKFFISRLEYYKSKLIKLL